MLSEVSGTREGRGGLGLDAQISRLLAPPIHPRVSTVQVAVPSALRLISLAGRDGVLRRAPRATRREHPVLIKLEKITLLGMGQTVENTAFNIEYKPAYR